MELGEVEELAKNKTGETSPARSEHTTLECEPGEMEPGKMEPGEMEPGEMEPGEMGLGKTEPGEMELGKMELGKVDEIGDTSLVRLKLTKLERETSAH